MSHKDLVLIVIETSEDAIIPHELNYVFLLTLRYYYLVIASYLKFYIRVTYLLAILTSLQRAVDIFNPFNRISLQFNIVVSTWHDFVSYAIVLPLVFSAQFFRPIHTFFRCKYLRYFSNSLSGRNMF